MSQIAKAYPDVVSIVEYGKTYEKRTISLLKVKHFTCWVHIQHTGRIPACVWNKEA